MAVVSQTIGPITAYAIAKAEGYTGTKEEFATEIANAATYAQTASTAASNAESSATSAASSASAAMSTTPTGYNTLMEALVAEYSTTATYAVGDYCRYNSVIYRCTTAVTTAGEFTSANWTAVTLADEVGALSTDLDTANESAMLGSIPYAANGEITGTTANGGLSVVQNGHLITVDGTSTATSAQAVTKVSICKPLLTWRNSTDPDEWSASKPIKFIANHTYQFAIKKTSGTFGGMIRLQGYDTNNTEIVRIELDTDTTEASANYTPTLDVNANFRLQYQRAVEFANATLQIDIYDITISSEVNGKQDALTFDTAPTENSTNPVTSGGVYTAVDNAKTADNQVAHDSVFYGGLAYWPVNPASAVTNDALTISQSGGYVTLDGTHTRVYAYAKLDKAFEIGSTTSTGGVAAQKALAKDTRLRAGHTYRVSVDIISGAYTEGVSTSKIRVLLYDTEDNTVAEVYAGNHQDITVYADTTVSVVLSSYGANNEFSQYKLLIKVAEIITDYDDTGIPNYYTVDNSTLYGDYGNYLNYKIGAINANAQTDTNHKIADSLIFITDYHGVISNRNAGYSPVLIKEITKKTGISKLVFGGDAGRTLEYTDYRRWAPAKEAAAIYSLLSESAPNFYGIVGNHDYNETQNLTNGALEPHDYAYSAEAVNQYYLMRENKPGITMGTGGCYYFDNTYAKIRYFFLQCDGFAGLSNENCEWFGNQLEEVPAGYAVLVFIHLAFLNQVCYSEGGTEQSYYSSLTPGTVSGIVNLQVKRISVLLDAFQNHSICDSTHYPVYQYDSTGTAGNIMEFDFTGTTGTVIGIICGHTHRDMVLSKSDNPDHVLVVATTTDSYGNNLDYNSAGTIVAREAGTITEQAFDVVQIDLDNKKLYMTRIGGGSDRELSFA